MEALADKSAGQIGNPMPLAFARANAYLKVREASVPEGHATIAQRFNVGTGAVRRTTPKGTAEGIRAVSAVPSGLRHLFTRYPTLKRWAIFKHPSGMKIEILVALDWKSALQGGGACDSCWTRAGR